MPIGAEATSAAINKTFVSFRTLFFMLSNHHQGAREGQALRFDLIDVNSAGNNRTVGAGVPNHMLRQIAERAACRRQAPQFEPGHLGAQKAEYFSLDVRIAEIVEAENGNVVSAVRIGRQDAGKRPVKTKSGCLSDRGRPKDKDYCRRRCVFDLFHCFSPHLAITMLPLKVLPSPLIW